MMAISFFQNGPKITTKKTSVTKDHIIKMKASSHSLCNCSALNETINNRAVFGKGPKGDILKLKLKHHFIFFFNLQRLISHDCTWYFYVIAMPIT